MKNFKILITNKKIYNNITYIKKINMELIIIK